MILPLNMMIPETTEDKDSPTPAPIRRPGPSRFLVPAGQRIAEDSDAAISAASFLSRDKICGKIRVSVSASSPTTSPVKKVVAAAAEIAVTAVQNGFKHSETENEEPKPKRGRGRPKKDERKSLPAMSLSRSSSASVSSVSSSSQASEDLALDRKRRCQSTESSTGSVDSTKRRCRSTGSDAEEVTPKRVTRCESVSSSATELTEVDSEISFVSRSADVDGDVENVLTNDAETDVIVDAEYDVLAETESNVDETSDPELVKRYKLRKCKISLIDINTDSEAESEAEVYSKPGPLSTKEYINVRKLNPSPAPAPSVISRESRESMSMDVVDEFVVDESASASTKTAEKVILEAPEIREVKDETDNDDSSAEEVEVLVTKSGRRVTKPKLQNFITAPSKINKILDLDSETEDEEEKALTNERIEELKKSLPDPFVPGDLAWARIGVAPYWPCTVTEDPDLLIHTNVVVKGKKVNREYHVQFFGRVQRAWVPDFGLMKFEGIESFQAKAEEIKRATGNTKKKFFKAFIPSSNAKVHWNEALTKMSEVVEWSNDDRLNHAKKLFLETTKGQQKLSQASGKRKRESGVSNSSKTEELPGKRPKLSFEAENLIKSIPTEVLEANRRKLKSGFKLFRLANQNKLQKEVASPDDLEKKLSRMWNQLSHKERQFYCDECLRISTSTEDGETEESNETENVNSDAPKSVVEDMQQKGSKNSVGKESKKSGENKKMVVKIKSKCGSDKKKAKAGQKESQLEDKEDEIVMEDDSMSEMPPSSKSSTVSGPVSKQTSTKSTTASPSVADKSVAKRQSSSAAASTQPASSGSAMIGQFKKESCCSICEDVSISPGDMIKCRGVCQNWFHLECLRLPESPNPETWKCDECTSGNHPCLLCKSTEGELHRCNLTSCGKFFHRSCLKNGLWPQARFSETQLTCPGHICHTCASDNPQDPFMKYNSRLVRCIRCPTAYHSGDYCITAGSIQITATQIVCPKHYVAPKSKKATMTHINTSWCFICSDGGSLICCELCPASFHPECLKIDPPEGVYYCDSCETGRLPLYGEVLWVKLGNYRWWPSKVVHPSEVPDNIERLPHDIGEFPIQFCGTKEYFWMNQGRCYPYQEGDSDKIPGSSQANTSSLAVSFRKGLAEAAKVFEEYSEEKNKRESANANKVQQQSQMKLPLFTRIKNNKPFGDVTVRTMDPIDAQVCECNPEKDEPCGKDSDCINRMLMLECCPTICRAKDRCGNMQFQRRVYPKMGVKRTASRGWGLFINQDVKKGDFLIEYVGELITTEEFKKRIALMLNDKDAEQNYYFMVMDNSRVIDAGPKGNVARFMNHSCDPNCETQKWTVNGDTKIGLFALEDIKGGTELTFNYQLEAFGEQKRECLCGAKNCSGFIGKKPSKESSQNANTTGRQASTAANKKKKKGKQVKVWEDLCFRCFDGGQLLMCDYKSCPKVYHMSCVEHETRPREKWICPWHHCVTCGNSALHHCIHCPNAYCSKHASDLTVHPVLGKICNEHTDEFNDILKFYQKAEGVRRLVSDPNQPVKYATKESIKLASAVKSKELATTQSANEVAKPKPAAEACRELNCQFVSKRDELLEHYRKQHNKTDEEIFRLTPRRSVLSKPAATATPSSPAKSELTPASRLGERLFQCPGCDREMRASLLRRHVAAQHPKLSLSKSGNELTPSGKRSGVAVVTTEGPHEKDVLEVKQEANEMELEGKQLTPSSPQRHAMSLTALNLTPASDACVPCSAPGCKKFIHHSNMARHWRCWHRFLNKADYPVGKVTGTSNSASPDDTSNQRLSEDKSMTESSPMIDSPADRLNASSGNLPMANGLYCCRSGGCDYATKYNSNMWRHRRKYNHFMDLDDSLLTSPEKDAKDEPKSQDQNDKERSKETAEVITYQSVEDKSIAKAVIEETVEAEREETVDEATENSPAIVITEDYTAEMITEDSTANVITKDSTADVITEDSRDDVISEDSTVEMISENSTVEMISEDSTVDKAADRFTAEMDRAASEIDTMPSKPDLLDRSHSIDASVDPGVEQAASISEEVKKTEEITVNGLEKVTKKVEDGSMSEVKEATTTPKAERGKITSYFSPVTKSAEKENKIAVTNVVDEKAASAPAKFPGLSDSVSPEDKVEEMVE